MDEQHKKLVMNGLGVNKSNVTRTHHLNCTAAICKTVQVDFTNHVISFTTITDGVSMARQSFSFKEFADITFWVSDAINPLENVMEPKAS